LPITFKPQDILRKRRGAGRGATGSRQQEKKAKGEEEKEVRGKEWGRDEVGRRRRALKTAEKRMQEQPHVTVTYTLHVTRLGYWW
jgi:hypothetical protein